VRDASTHLWRVKRRKLVENDLSARLTSCRISTRNAETSSGAAHSSKPTGTSLVSPLREPQGSRTLRVPHADGSRFPGAARRRGEGEEQSGDGGLRQPQDDQLRLLGAAFADEGLWAFVGHGLCPVGGKRSVLLVRKYFHVWKIIVTFLSDSLAAQTVQSGSKAPKRG
jgi:hypothetical protein